MTVELLVFSFLSIFLFLILFFSESKKLNKLMIFLTIIYILTVRFSGFHDDFLNYIEVLKYPVIYKIYFFYYLREWFFWILGTFIYQISNSFEVTFLLYDFFCLHLLIKIQKELKIPSYFILLFFLCFPSVMGFQNIYRQFIATVLFLYALSLAYNFKKTKFLFYFLALFTHNSIILFFPLLFVFSKTKVFSSRFLVSILLVLGVLFFGATTKSYSSHGLSLVFIYLLFLFTIWIFIFSVRKLKNNLKFKQISIFSSYLFLFSTFLYFIVGESQLERISMIGIQVSLPFIIVFIDRFYKQKKVLRAVLVVLLIIPMFLFKNAFSLLVNIK